MVCMNGGGDRSRCSPGVPADCGPVALRFLLEFPISKRNKEKTGPHVSISYRVSLSLCFGRTGRAS